MAKRIQLTERELITIIKRIVNEDGGRKGLRGPRRKGVTSAPTAPPCTVLQLDPIHSGCCSKCNNLPNPFGPFTPAELTYLGVCAPHCPCC